MSSDNPDILDGVFKHCDLELDTPLLDSVVADQVPRSSHNIMQEERDGHEKMTRKLFGNDYHKEYGAPVVRQVLRDHAIELGRPQHQLKRKI